LLILFEIFSFIVLGFLRFWKDVAGGIGREAVGENASGRAATNDDVIITKVVGRDDGPLLFC
jgi:hypothetical protein